SPTAKPARSSCASPPCTLVGRVVDDIGNSLDGARVVITHPGKPFGRRVLYAGEGGRFRAQRLSPGLVHVAASTPGLVTAHREVRLPMREDAELEIALGHEGTTLEGLVTGPDGAPVPGARISALPAQAAAPPRTTVTNEVGHFRIEGLPTGRAVVRA